LSRESRCEKLRDLMDRLGLGVLLMRRPANFAWYAGGADNRVDRAGALGVAGALLTREPQYIITDNIEAPRMRAEETPSFEVVKYPWHEYPSATLRALSGASPLGADFPAGEARDVWAEISPLRYVLDPDAIGRDRQLGTDADAAVSEVAAPSGRMRTSSRPRPTSPGRAADAACSRPCSSRPRRNGWVLSAPDPPRRCSGPPRDVGRLRRAWRALRQPHPDDRLRGPGRRDGPQAAGLRPHPPADEGGATRPGRTLVNALAD
jgi:hypothetical protein